MPDLIQHPSRLWRDWKYWIPAFAGMAILIEVAIYKQTLITDLPEYGASFPNEQSLAGGWRKSKMIKIPTSRKED